MKIGLFGGSFNPIHSGHVEIVKSTLESKVVDEVWIMPCSHHAFDKPLEKDEYRIKMVNLAIKGIKGVKLSTIEIGTKEKNYTIDTLRKLRSKYDHEFFPIVGSDILYEIKKWHNYKDLIKKTEFIISKREDYPVKEVKGFKIRYTLRGNKTQTSSTQIREMIKQNKLLRGLLPENVEKYIAEKGLYK